MKKFEELEDLISKEGYSSANEVIQDWVLMVALSKVEQYKAECEFFSNKYQMKLEEFEVSLHKEKGKEDFQKEEDLDDWEFALHALKWWGKKVKRLQIATNF